MSYRSAMTSRVRHLALCVGALLAAAACTPNLRSAPAGAEFVIVRHAEKGNDGPRDPTLSAAGLARAQRLAGSLRNSPLVAVYATGYHRTQQTATPAAVAHGLAVTTYDAQQPADAFAAMLRRNYPRGTVLVVGHSNTAPAIAAALCACSVPATGDDVYGRRLMVRIGVDGQARLTETVDP